MDKLDSITSSWECEIRCLKCHSTRWVPWDKRHAGEKKFSGTTQATWDVRCKTCPTGMDFTEWTGRKREKK